MRLRKRAHRQAEPAASRHVQQEDAMKRKFIPAIFAALVAALALVHTERTENHVHEPELRTTERTVQLDKYQPPRKKGPKHA